MPRRRLPFLALPLLAGLFAVGALAGCGASADEHGAQAPGAVESASADGDVQVLTVDAGDDLKFRQTDLRAHTGTVRIVLRVTGRVPHNLILADGPLANADTGTVSDSTASLTLRFTKPGTYRFLCSIHPRMTGTITIS